MIAPLSAKPLSVAAEIDAEAFRLLQQGGEEAWPIAHGAVTDMPVRG